MPALAQYPMLNTQVYVASMGGSFFTGYDGKAPPVPGKYMVIFNMGSILTRIIIDAENFFREDLKSFFHPRICTY